MIRYVNVEETNLLKKINGCKYIGTGLSGAPSFVKAVKEKMTLVFDK